MSENEFDEFIDTVRLVRDLRAGGCPVGQCGGKLEYIEERTNWQEPDTFRTMVKKMKTIKGINCDAKKMSEFSLKHKVRIGYSRTIFGKNMLKYVGGV